MTAGPGQGAPSGAAQAAGVPRATTPPDPGCAATIRSSSNSNCGSWALALGSSRDCCSSADSAAGAILRRAWRKELSSTLCRAQLFGQLVTTRAHHSCSILGLVGRLVLGQRSPARSARNRGSRQSSRCLPSVSRRSRSTPASPTRPDHTTSSTSPNRSSKRLLVPDHEPRDRRVIRHHIARDHPVGHVLATVTLDRARGTLPWSHTHTKRVSASSTAHTPLDRDHRPDTRHRTPPSPSRHSVDHEPRQMIRRQPIPHVRRQQEPLLTTTFDEVLSHLGILLNAPDGTVCATASSTPGPLLDARARPCPHCGEAIDRCPRPGCICCAAPTARSIRIGPSISSAGLRAIEPAPRVGTRPAGCPSSSRMRSRCLTAPDRSHAAGRYNANAAVAPAGATGPDNPTMTPRHTRCLIATSREVQRRPSGHDPKSGLIAGGPDRTHFT